MFRASFCRVCLLLQCRMRQRLVPSVLLDNKLFEAKLQSDDVRRDLVTVIAKV